MGWFNKQKATPVVEDTATTGKQDSADYPWGATYRQRLMTHARSLLTVDEQQPLRSGEAGKLIVFNGVGFLIRGESANIPDLAYMHYLEEMWNWLLRCNGIEQKHGGVVPRAEVIRRYDIGGVAEGLGYTVGSLEPIVPAYTASSLRHRNAADGLHLLKTLQDVIPVTDMLMISEHEKELIRNIENLGMKLVSTPLSHAGQIFSRIRFKD
ncbi:hypothetical protein Ea357_044 [Erwinia phage Ea35-70]|uniref:Uncharacterized protein n=1 Tax=Erwinia phage Ea35-70 TaxID=1429768 RepID=W6B1B2_9CAUD|nr:hypothetical protein Ea357_044 [Erwinia phage Ea35-70]AHI60194.1 hypothetical protein Ea357_044 [Erwinia phage Ea35-70]